MQNKVKMIMAVAALAGGVRASMAGQTINGETGLILNPTAQVVQKDRPQIQANYYEFDSEWNDKSYGIYGALSPADKLEISGGFGKYRSDDDRYEHTGVAIGAKYQLLSQTEKGFDLAVGGGYNRVLDRNTYVYAALSKSFGDTQRARINGTLGVRWDRHKNDWNGTTDKASIFAGVEVPLTREGEFSLIGELQSKNIDSDAARMPYALGLRYQPGGQAFSISAGVQRQGLLSPWESRAKLFVQAGYTFGK